MDKLTGVKRYFKDWLLVLIACVLILIAMPVGFIAESLFNRSKYYPRNIAISLDQLANTTMPSLCTMLFIDGSKQVYCQFGNPDETLSSVLGKNKRINAISNTGLALCKLLHKFDPNHCSDSIEDDEGDYR